MSWKNWLIKLSLAIATGIIIVATQLSNLVASQELAQDRLPPFKTHPLPLFLANWQDREHQGDYFNQIQTTPLGYLIWSRFPIKVYLEKSFQAQEDTAEEVRFRQWIETVRKAVAEWNVYLPIVEVENSQSADLVIERASIEREIKLDRATRRYEIPRASTAQTNYEFYLKASHPAILSHRMKIKISPNLSTTATLAATRHELGHALGIWGHSSRQTDALYFSQVKAPAHISARDLNTLKKIYQQPTKLGWSIVSTTKS